MTHANNPFSTHAQPNNYYLHVCYSLPKQNVLGGENSLIIYAKCSFVLPFSLSPANQVKREKKEENIIVYWEFYRSHLEP